MARQKPEIAKLSKSKNSETIKFVVKLAEILFLAAIVTIIMIVILILFFLGSLASPHKKESIKPSASFLAAQQKCNGSPMVLVRTTEEQLFEAADPPEITYSVYTPNSQYYDSYKQPSGGNFIIKYSVLSYRCTLREIFDTARQAYGVIPTLDKSELTPAEKSSLTQIATDEITGFKTQIIGPTIDLPGYRLGVKSIYLNYIGSGGQAYITSQYNYYPPAGTAKSDPTIYKLDLVCMNLGTEVEADNSSFSQTPPQIYTWTRVMNGVKCELTDGFGTLDEQTGTTFMSALAPLNSKDLSGYLLNFGT